MADGRGQMAEGARREAAGAALVAGRSRSG